MASQRVTRLKSSANWLCLRALASTKKISGNQKLKKCLGYITTLAAGGIIGWFTAWFLPAPLSVEPIQEEIIDNMEILYGKIKTADQNYYDLVRFDAEPDKYNPNLYAFIPARLQRDLPRFKSRHKTELERSKLYGNAKLVEFKKMYKALEGVEESEKEIITALHTMIERFNLQKAVVVGMPIVRKTVGCLLLETNYLVPFNTLRDRLAKLGVEGLPSVPTDLHFLSRVKEGAELCPQQP